MTVKTTVEAARVELLLGELRLPGVKLMWAKLAEQSDKEGWPTAWSLAAIAEHEVADRGRRRMERQLAEARLPADREWMACVLRPHHRSRATAPGCPARAGA